MFRLKCPGNERRETASLVLERAELFEMIDAMTNGLAHAGHHRAGCAQAQSVRFSMNHQPFLARAFKRADIATNFIVENLTASSGHGIQPSSFQPFESLGHGQS